MELHVLRIPAFVRAARYASSEHPDTDVRSSPPQSAPEAFSRFGTVVILYPELPRSRRRFRKNSGIGFRGECRLRPIPSPDGSKLCFCPTNWHLSDKNACSARSRPFRNPVKKENDMRQKKRSYKYSFRLDEQQNIRFKQMLCESGLEHNRSRFIVKRIFAECFEVVRRDPSKGEFVARLNDFHYQFQRIGSKPSIRTSRRRRFRIRSQRWNGGRAS